MQSASEITFRQVRSRLVSDAIVLRHDRVIIRAGVPDITEERHVSLSDIAPDIEFTKQRFTGGFWVLLVFAAIFAAAALKVSGPGPLRFALPTLFGTFAFSCVLAGFISCDPISVATVKSRKGETLFQLRREQSVAAEYEEFLLQFRRRLKSWTDDSQS